jgi:hypothetical protein
MPEYRDPASLILEIIFLIPSSSSLDFYCDKKAYKILTTQIYEDETMVIEKIESHIKEINKLLAKIEYRNEDGPQSFIGDDDHLDSALGFNKNDHGEQCLTDLGEESDEDSRGDDSGIGSNLTGQTSGESGLNFRKSRGDSGSLLEG